MADKIGQSVHDSVQQSDLVTIAEAATRLGKSNRTIRRMIASGTLNSVEIGGRKCVQLAGYNPKNSDRQMSGQDEQMSKKDVHTADKIGQNVRTVSGTVSDPVIDSLQEIIRRQDSEISYMRGELTAVREALENVTRMLPLPKENPQNEQPTKRRWKWPWKKGSLKETP